MADQELSKTELNQNDSNLIDILASLLNDENSVTVLTPQSPISTTGLIYTHGNCTPCSEKKCKSAGVKMCKTKILMVIAPLVLVQ